MAFKCPEKYRFEAADHQNKDLRKLKRHSITSFLTTDVLVELDRKTKEELRRRMSNEEEEKRKLVSPSDLFNL